MRTAIDAGGRVVIPKPIRERLGGRPGAEVELAEVDGRVEIAPAVAPIEVVEVAGRLVPRGVVELPVGDVLVLTRLPPPHRFHPCWHATC